MSGFSSTEMIPGSHQPFEKKWHADGLVQEMELAIELRLSCINPWMWYAKCHLKSLVGKRNREGCLCTFQSTVCLLMTWDVWSTIRTKCGSPNCAGSVQERAFHWHTIAKMVLEITFHNWKCGFIAISFHVNVTTFDKKLYNNNELQSLYCTRLCVTT